MAVIAVFVQVSPAFAGENCTCRYKDSDIGEGQTICMHTPNGAQMATCSRVLNNTSWKFLGTPCPLAQAPVKQNASEVDQQMLDALLDKIEKSG